MASIQQDIAGFDRDMRAARSAPAGSGRWSSGRGSDDHDRVDPIALMAARLSEGQTVATAAALATAAAAKFEAARNLALIMCADIVVGIRDARTRGNGKWIAS